MSRESADLRSAEGADTGERAPVWSAEDWRAFLAGELGGCVDVRYGRARHTVVRVVRRGAKRVVHMNAVFAHAPEPIRRALASWMRSGRRARTHVRTLDQWIDQRISRLHAEAPRPIELQTRGAVHDLAALAENLRASEFAGEFGAARPWPRITWGRSRTTPTRRSLRLGSFDPHAVLVRVHPVLDQPSVPRSFVRYVLFHELLHAALDEGRHANGRRVLHGPKFRRRERDFPETAGARAWERAHIDALIRSARTGKPLSACGEASASSAGQWLQRLLFD